MSGDLRKAGSFILPLDQIHVPSDRIQPVIEDEVEALAIQIREDGQRNAIGVYRSNASKTGRPYTLIYGARRYAALKRLGIEEISVVLRKQSEALKLEIQDNLDFVRNDILREAAYIAHHRKWWEELYGKIGPGQPKKELSQKCENSFPNYFNNLMDNYGVAKARAERLHRIETGLSDDLKALFRNTKTAGNLGKLLTCAKLEPSDQSKVAIGLRDGAKLEACLKQIKPEGGRMDEDERLMSLIVDAMGRLNSAKRAQVLSRLGVGTVVETPIEKPAITPIEVAPTVRDYDKGMASWAAKRKPRKKPMRDPAVAREREFAWFEKTFIEPLAKLLVGLDAKRGTPLIDFCRKLRSDGEQFLVACELGNGHDFRDAEYRIERYREEPEREWETIAAWKLQNTGHYKSFINVVARYAPRQAATENLDNGAIMQEVLAAIPDLTGEEDGDFTPEEFQGMVARLHPFLAKKMLESRSLLDRQLLETVLQLNHAEQIYVAHDVPGVSWRGEAYRRAWEILEKKHMGKAVHTAGNA